VLLNKVSMLLPHVSRIAINPRVSLNIRRKIARDARATCDRRDQSAHELAPLAVPSNTNAFTCVYINVIAVGSNSFFPPFLHSLLSGTTLLGHYKSNPLQLPLTRYLSAPRVPSYLAIHMHSLMNARTPIRRD